MRLHIGCGDKRLEGYVNIDAREGPAVDYVADASDLPYQDDSVDLVYACHVLEHFPRAYVGIVLTEWGRVLKPQIGLLRLAVPNFEVMCYLYKVKGVHLERLQGLLHGGQTYESNHHYSTWDFETLCCELRRWGFFNMQLWNEQDPQNLPQPPEYRDFSMMRMNGYPCSLNVEALKI